jgi:hypothetical protein
MGMESFEETAVVEKEPTAEEIDQAGETLQIIENLQLELKEETDVLAGFLRKFGNPADLETLAQGDYKGLSSRMGLKGAPKIHAWGSFPEEKWQNFDSKTGKQLN